MLVKNTINLLADVMTFIDTKVRKNLLTNL